jgi:WD40 repeat protein
MAAMTSVTFNPADGEFISGSVTGSLYFWNDKTCVKSVPIHEGAVMALQ